MTEFDSSTLLYPFLLFLCLLIVGCAYSARVRAVLRSVYPVWLAVGVGLGVILLWSIALYEYLIFPGYIDHIQPTVASVSWLAVHGRPIWPNWETGDIYGMLYGPLLYLLTGFFLLLDPSIFMSKLPGLAALLGVIVCLWWALRQKKIDGVTIFLLIAAFLTAQDPRLVIAYENRSDSFLIFLATLSLPVAFEWPVLRSAIGVGILAGLCAGFKAHGFFYVIPAALAVAARGKDMREFSLIALAGCGTALAVIALPFLLVSQVANADGYLHYLRIGAHHGLSMEAFLDEIVVAITLAAPLLTVLYWWRPALGRPERWFLIGLGGAVAATLVIGAKPGSGTHNLWPLFPACFYAMACSLSADSRAGYSQKPQTIMAVVVLMLIVTYAGWQRTSYIVMDFFYDRRYMELAKIADVEDILKDYPDAQFGISEVSNYHDSLYRVLGVFQGAPLRLDIPSWLDLAFAGIPESAAARSIELCTVRVWVLPLGKPFEQITGYTHQPLFSDEFRAEFNSNYKLVQQDDFYQVWVCK